MMCSRVFLLPLLLHVAAAFKSDCPRPCITIDRCPGLLGLIQKNPVVVREATCGFDGLTPLVCCPITREPVLSGSTITSIVNTTSPEPPPNTLLPEICGHFADQERIVGGNLTDLGSFPWMAALGYRSQNSKTDFLCGGAVISERYILTAAHCLDREPEVIRLAEWDLSSDIDCMTAAGFEFCNTEGAQDFQYEELIQHPDYRKRGHVSDDIALIRLSRPIRFSRWIQPVCLPDRDFDVPAAVAERDAIVTGWGFTENGTTSDILLQVSLPLVDMAQCSSVYKKKSVTLVGKQLCFGGIEGKDSCGGDSGGPIVVSQGSAPPYMQIGIVSFGPRQCGMKDFPGVYADVTKYRDWIDENMKP